MSALMRPGGLIRPSPIARQQGLVFALDFAAPDALPWLSAGQGSANGAFTGGSARTTTRRGWGMTGTNGYWRVPIGTAGFSLPTTQGTVLFHAVSATASGDPVFNRRYMWAFGRGDAGWPNSPWCGGSDFDGNIEAGWVGGGVDGRMKISSASGAAWAANSTPLIGFSYGPGGQSLYYNGAFAGSNSFNNFGNTSAQYLSVGDGELNIWWNRSDGDAILYLLVFDREFSQGEHARAARDPWWWVDQPPRLRRGPPVIAVSLTGIGLVSAAGSVTGQIQAALSGAAATSARGTVAPAIAVAATGQALTTSAGSLAYSLAFTLTGQAAASAAGTLTGDPSGLDRTLTGIQMTALPGNVSVTGGTRWYPQQPRTETPAVVLGNTLPPPPRATGNAEVDLRALNQWVNTLYDQWVKGLNIMGKVQDMDGRIARLEEKE